MSEQRTEPVAGTYGSFAEVPGPTGYNTEENLRSLLIYCERRADELLAGDFPHSLQRNLQNNILVGVAASMLGRQRLRILDYGGGLGQSFITLAAGIPDYQRRIDYAICDLPDTIAYAKANDIYSRRGIHCIRFVNDLSEIARCDLAYLGSVLQYHPDWRGLLAAIAKLRPSTVVLNQVPIVMQPPTFVMSQKISSRSRQPYWVFNIRELVEAFSESGFRLAARASEFFGDKDGSGDRSFPHLPADYHDFRRAVLFFKRVPIWHRILGRKQSQR